MGGARQVDRFEDPEPAHGLFPDFLEPRRTAEKALAAAIQEAYIQDVTIRSVAKLVKEMGITGK